MSDLPRLLLCCFDVVPAPTAISRRLTEYLKGLSDRYQVVVLSVKTPDHTHIERYQGARLLRVPVGSGDLAARVQAFDRAVRRQLDSEEYVMVHFFDPFGGYALCERRAEFGFKLIYDACSLPSVDLPFLYGEEEANRRFIAKVRRQELYCLMNADVVVVANDVTRDFVTGLGVSREQVQVLPAPVDLGPYDPKVMGPPTSEPMRLIHLGNQSSAQDLGVVLEALKLAQATAEVHLTIVGPKHDEHQARLEEQVGALGLTGKVEFQPPVAHDDLHKVLAAADVGLLTLADVERNSRVGSPLSRLGEYLAAGRPVIAADVASARALLPDDGVVLYRPGEVQSLVDAITSLATEPTRRAKLGTAARAAALERDGLKVRADLVAIYVNLSGTGVRAVGDADATTPDEPTQLGRSSLDADDTQRRKAERARTDPPSGTNKVKTDPAIAAADETSPEAAMGERPSVMGVPLRDDEPPVVVGQEVRDLAAELAQVTTEPNAQRFTDPPVVMGMPLASATTPKTGPHLSLVPKEDDAPDQKASPGPEDGPQEKTPSPHAPAVLDELGQTGGPDEPLQAGAPISPPLADEPIAPPFASSPTVHDVPAAPPPFASSPTVHDVPAAPPTFASSPTVHDVPAAPPPFASSPTVIEPPAASPPVVIPPLELPPLSVPPLAAPRPPPLTRTTSGVFSVAPPPPPARSTSGVLPVVPSSQPIPPLELPPPLSTSPSAVRAARPDGAPLELPPPLSTSPSAVRAARSSDGSIAPLELPPPLTTSPSGLRTGPPALPRSVSGTFPVAPPPRTASGLHSVIAPPVSARPAASGLFPTAPAVPEAPVKIASASSTGPEEISESEIEEVDDGPEEVGDDEVVEAEAPASAAEAEADSAPAEVPEESVMTVDTDASPPPSAIDPWLAQLVHGYCPPESGLFERHTPPTTMPGRDT